MTIDDIKSAFCQDDDYNIFKDVINHMNNEYDTTCTSISTDNPLSDRKDYVMNKADDHIDSRLPYFNVFEDDFPFDESDEVDEAVEEEEAITEEYDDFYGDITYAYT